MSVNGPSNIDGVRRQDLPQTTGAPADKGVGNIPIGRNTSTGSTPGLSLENTRQAQIDAEFQASDHLFFTKEHVKAARKKAGIGTSFPAKMAFNKGLGDQKTADIRNEYAKIIFTEGFDTPELKEVARQYISELPKCARKGEETEFRAACEQKLEAFRAAARGMKNTQNIMDNDNYNTAYLENTIVRSANGIKVHIDKKTGELKEFIDEKTGEVIARVDLKAKEIIINDNKNAAKTWNKINQAVVNINAHTDAVGAQVTQDVTQNMGAALGVDLTGYTVRNDKGDFVLANGETVAPEQTAVGQINEHTDAAVADGVKQVNEHTDAAVADGVKQVNEHTSKEHNQTRLEGRQNDVLLMKRDTLSDMLTTEQVERWPGNGAYRDSTVQWLGSSADRIMADNELTFQQKQEAMNELIRMVDEENIISDGDKAAFENKYFVEHRPHSHI